MLSRLPISLAQLEAGNNFNKLKNEIRQLLYFLYCSKNITKQVYNNLIKHIWIKNIISVHKIFVIIIVTIKDIHYKMEIILNTENSKTSEPHRFRLDLTDKLNLQNPKINMEINK